MNIDHISSWLQSTKTQDTFMCFWKLQTPETKWMYEIVTKCWFSVYILQTLTVDTTAFQTGKMFVAK